MNCLAVQTKILSLPDPRVIPTPLLTHVSDCAACRVWAKQAARLESLLEQLPVPPAPGNKKAEMIDDLAGGDLVIFRPHVGMARESFARTFIRFLEQNKMVAGGLAVAILVVLGGWWMLNGPTNTSTVSATPPRKDPFLEKMVRWDVDLAKAQTAEKRLEILGGMAEGITNQTRSLARVVNKEELWDLARWYDKVVNDGVVKQANKLPFPTMTIDERAKHKEQISALAKQLGETATQAEKMTEVPPDAKPALEKIAKAAREGEEKLRKLANPG
jgi:hypothetical protein